MRASLHHHTVWYVFWALLVGSWPLLFALQSIEPAGNTDLLLAMLLLPLLGFFNAIYHYCTNGFCYCGSGKDIREHEYYDDPGVVVLREGMFEE